MTAIGRGARVRRGAVVDGEWVGADVMGAAVVGGISVRLPNAGAGRTGATRDGICVDGVLLDGAAVDRETCDGDPADGDPGDDGRGVAEPPGVGGSVGEGGAEGGVDPVIRDGRGSTGRWPNVRAARVVQLEATGFTAPPPLR
jgi:hypothetical protein